MGLPIIGLVGAVMPAISDIIKRAFPDPIDQERARAEIEAQIRDAESDFRDFILRYEGEGKDIPVAMQVLRSSVRPILTYALAGLFAWGFINPGAVSGATMELLWQLNLISLGFWYGERALRNLGVDVPKIIRARREAEPSNAGAFRAG